jgi:hypothetical protein
MKKNQLSVPLNGMGLEITADYETNNSLKLLCVLSLSAKTYSQETRINIEVANNNILEVFDEIEKVTDFGFFFKSDQLDLSRLYSLKLKNATIEEIWSVF